METKTTAALRRSSAGVTPSTDVIVHDRDGLRVGYHNARAATCNDTDCFVGWVRVNGRFIDSGPEHGCGDSEGDAMAWCARQVAMRASAEAT